MKDRTFRDHIAPVERRRFHVPPPKKQSAVRLSRKIGLRKTAYVFGVSVWTVWRWRADDLR